MQQAVAYDRVAGSNVGVTSSARRSKATLARHWSCCVAVLAAAGAPASLAADVSFNNTTPIVIALNTPAAPYPSVINVSGISGNVITKAQVILKSFGHGYPDDVDILLEAPDGTRSIVMSDVGGSQPVADKLLSFSPTAAAPAPDSTLISDAVPLRATNVPESGAEGVTDTFASPGPGSVVSGVADLDAFNGVNPNGDWKLYVVDDFPLTGTGSIVQGWTLVLSVPTVLTVTKAADTSDGTCNADCSLREAVATAGSGALIRFAIPLFNSPQTITLGSGLIALTKDVTIQGPGAALLTVSGGDQTSIFGSNPGIAVSLSGMTLSGGRVFGDGGGAIFSQGPLSLRNMAISGNRSVDDIGGGMLILGAPVNIVGSTFSDNHAGGVGGLGGGAFEFQSFGGPTTLRIANSTISGNTSAGSVGGIGVFHSAQAAFFMEVINSTIADNQGKNHGGVEFITLGGIGATVGATLRNTIIANNQPDNLAKTPGGGGPITVASRGYNLTNDAVNADLIRPSDKKNANPRLGPLNNNGGQVETRALLGGSLALDAGERSGYASDARGLTRSFDTPNLAPSVDGDSSDIGAVEMHSLIVTNILDSGPGSLRDAIGSANSRGGQDDIIFDAGLFGVVPQMISIAASPLPLITESLSVNGPGAKLLTVRRGTSDFRIFDATVEGQEFAFSGLTISNGRGGIASFSRLSVAQAAFADNSARFGGGIALQRANGTVKDSSFNGNAAIVSSGGGGVGGGIYFGGLNHLLRVAGTTLSDNAAEVGGGGINSSAFEGSSRVEIVNSTIVNNESPSGGGVEAYTQDPGIVATISLRNTIVANNTLPNLVALIGICDGCSAQIVSRGYNLSNDPTSAMLNLPSDRINLDPLLGPLADNGGDTRTHALLPGSPALDSGEWSGSLRDQRGATRPNDQPDIPNAAGTVGYDIGAVEDDTLFRNGFE